MAKRFFYVCAGLFLLALSYHLGARSAGAQILGQPIGNIADGNACAVLGGSIYAVRLTSLPGPNGPPASIPLPRPGNVIGVGATEDSLEPAYIGMAWVIYDDGAVYHYTLAAGWEQVASLFSVTPVAAQGTTWGQVKDRYRK